jgi:hypothetical protein
MNIVSACRNADFDEVDLQRYHVSSRHNASMPATRVLRAINAVEYVSERRVAKEWC